MRNNTNKEGIASSPSLLAEAITEQYRMQLKEHLWHREEWVAQEKYGGLTFVCIPGHFPSTYWLTS